MVWEAKNWPCEILSVAETSGLKYSIARVMPHKMNRFYGVIAYLLVPVSKLPRVLTMLYLDEEILQAQKKVLGELSP